MRLGYVYEIYLEIATFLVVSDEVVFVEKRSRGVDEVFSVMFQQSVVSQLVVRNAIKSWRPKHSYVQVRVSCKSRQKT